MHPEENALLTKAIKLRIAIKKTGGDELIEYAHDKGGKYCEKHIVKGKSPRFINNFAREGILEGILLDTGEWEAQGVAYVRGTHPELRHIQSNVFVERVKDDFGDSLITPSSVYKQQFPEVAKLTNGDIGTAGSLETLNTADADSNMRCLDH